MPKNSCVLALFCAIVFGIFFASEAFANEPTRTAVCIRISRSGDLLSTTLYKSPGWIRSEQAIAAIKRAAGGSFPPLPEGSPEFMDFHFDVTCGCTGWIMKDEMRLCKQAHVQPNTQSGPTETPKAQKSSISDDEEADEAPTNALNR